MKKITKLFGIICLLVGLASCGDNGNTTPYDYLVGPVHAANGTQLDPLNTRVMIRMFEDSEPVRTSITDLYKNSIHQSHRLFDRHYDYTVNDIPVANLKTINDSYGTDTPVVIDSTLFDLLSMSIDIAEQTNGYFNPTMGNLLDLWQYYEDEYDGTVERYTNYGGQRPDPEPTEVATAQACIVPASSLREIIDLNEEDSSVTFHRYQSCNSVTLSLGAIAKGFALDLAKQILMAEYPDVPMILDAGSSSIVTIGINPTPSSANRPKKYKGKWLVGMISANVPPLTLDRSAYVVATLAFSGAKAFSTSGDFEKYYYSTNSDPIGIKRNHILNPHTGYSERHWRLLSLFGDGPSAVLDGLSTALINVESPTEIISILQAMNLHFSMNAGVFIEEDSDQEGKLNLYASHYFANEIDSTTIKSSLVTSTEISLLD